MSKQKKGRRCIDCDVELWYAPRRGVYGCPTCGSLFKRNGEPFDLPKGVALVDVLDDMAASRNVQLVHEFRSPVVGVITPVVDGDFYASSN